MVEEKMIRLSQAARELNVGVSTLTEHLAAQGVKDVTTNSKITLSQLEKIAKELSIDIRGISLIMTQKQAENTEIAQKEVKVNPEVIKEEKTIPKEEKKVEAEIKKEAEPEVKEEEVTDNRNKLQGIKVIGKIDLDKNKKGQTVKIKETPKQETPQDTSKNIEEVKTNVAEVKEVVAEKKTEKKTVAKEEKIKKEKIAEPTAIVKKEEVETVKEVVVEKKKEEKANTKKEEVIVEKTTKEKQEKVEVATKKEEIIEAVIEKVEVKELELIKAQADLLPGLKVLGKIVLPTKGTRPVASSDDRIAKKKRKRKKKTRFDEVSTTNTANTTQQNSENKTQINAKEQGTNNSNTQNNTGNNQNRTNTTGNNNQNRTNTTGNNNQNRTNTTGNNNQNRSNTTGNNNQNRTNFNKPRTTNDSGTKEEISAKQVDEKLKETLAKMAGGSSNKKKSFRKSKHHHNNNNDSQQTDAEDAKILKATEFISANDLASMMDVSVNEVISVCLNLGMFVSINQRLDAEAITFIADEFGFSVDFTSVEVENKTEDEEEEDTEEDLVARAPIVTIMGHVDHGKTSLLDYIRQTNVTSQESGGITQHIGAYEVMTSAGKKITFLDTPGHEAFTAMRARGAKVTDVVILVVAADDNVMPQTKEAINHAKMAGVPIVIAINKIDKSTADPERIKQELAQENVLVESWGGKYQDEAISAKTGLGIPDLLEKVLLEAEILDLKANPVRKAKGTVIEAALDKGRGYVTNVLVQTGTMRVGDIILAGSHYGRVKAMHDHRGLKVEIAGPSTPVQVLGLNGAPQAGDIVKVVGTEKEAREITAKREQILREQSIRTRKGLTLGDIGRRIALGNFQELKIIVKGDVDGSVEALSDSLLKLSTEEIEVKIIHKAVGQISESDVMLASAFEAIIIGFQVRPSSNAKRLSEQEKVEIKHYSVIYDAINDVRDAMEGMLAPKIEEKIVGNIEIREVFKISKVGTVAGCYVTEGYVKRANKIRLIRDGIVIFDGELDTLKRFKDDVSEVKFGFECGASIRNFNDIKEGDIIESYEQRETKRTLAPL